jgi:hypothetical protein
MALLINSNWNAVTNQYGEKLELYMQHIYVYIISVVVDLVCI